MKAKPQEKNKRATNHPTQHHWHEMNRKQRRETMRKIQSEDRSLEVIHPDAAGIDIGNESHYVAVPPGRDSQPIRCFGLIPRSSLMCQLEQSFLHAAGENFAAVLGAPNDVIFAAVNLASLGKYTPSLFVCQRFSRSFI